MKKRSVLLSCCISVFLLSVLCFSPSAVAAFDFGATIDNETGFIREDASIFRQRDRLALWFDGRFADTYSISAQASYTFDIERSFFLTLDLLRFGGEFLFPGRFIIAFDAGRFRFTEFSGKVLSHTADGIYYAMGFPFGDVSLSVGYTGLLQVPESTIVMSDSDAADRQIDPPPAFGPSAPPRLFEAAEIQLTELFLLQTLTVSILFQQDLRGPARFTSGGGKVHTNYMGVGFTGPVLPFLYYDYFLYLGMTTTQVRTSAGLCTGAGLDLYLPDLLNGHVYIDILFASGNDDADSFYESTTGTGLGPFLPVSYQPAGLVFVPQLSNIFFSVFGFSLKPFSMFSHRSLKNILFDISIIPFMRPTRGPVSTPGLIQGSDKLYLGTELDISIRANPFNELGLGYGMGFFFPGSAFSSQRPRLAGRFELSLTL